MLVFRTVAGKYRLQTTYVAVAGEDGVDGLADWRKKAGVVCGRGELCGLKSQSQVRE